MVALPEISLPQERHKILKNINIVPGGKECLIINQINLDLES